MSDETLEARIAAKMRREGLGEATIAAFLDAHRRVRRGERGLISEAEIEPISDLPRLESLPSAEGMDEVGLLRQLAVFKLNGGLGTGMGLDRTKSLLRVRGGGFVSRFHRAAGVVPAGADGGGRRRGSC
jgi:UTP--glucose-1-phosphate uridylyltransferase